jgi:5-methylcytosine-specific restriction endonuclease McrA
MSQHSSSGRPWKRLQQQVFDEETLCCRCGGWVDQSIADPNHPMARSVDHLVERQLGGSDDRDNLRLAHRACNAHAATPAGILGRPAPTPPPTVYEPYETCADCGRIPHLHPDRVGYGREPSYDGIGTPW